LKPEIYSLRSRPPWPRSGTTAYFVSTLGLEPEPFHTVVDHNRRPQTEACCRRRDPRRTHLTGTFNLFVKDRIAFRLSGALSGQARLTQGKSRCPRNLLKLQSPPYNCQPEGITRLPQLFNSREGTQLQGLRATKDAFRLKPWAEFRRKPRRKHSNLEKDHLEVLADDA